MFSNDDRLAKVHRNCEARENADHRPNQLEPLSEGIGQLLNFARGTIGEPCRIRTGDPLLKRQMLYRLS